MASGADINGMLGNPYLNAVYALGYIGTIIFVISQTEKIASNTPDTLLAPLTMLSLLVLSVAVMAVLFFYEPVRLLIEGEKQKALHYLLKMVGAFAVIVFVLGSLLFYSFVVA